MSIEFSAGQTGAHTLSRLLWLTCGNSHRRLLGTTSRYMKEINCIPPVSATNGQATRQGFILLDRTNRLRWHFVREMLG